LSQYFSQSAQQDADCLSTELREEQSCEDLQSYITTLQKEHDQALADQTQCAALTTGARNGIEKSVPELEGFRQAAVERDQAAAARALGKDKQRR